MGETAQFTLGELVDLALCTPVVGVVNFNILRIVLQTMIKELKLESLNPQISIDDMLHASKQRQDSTFMLDTVDSEILEKIESAQSVVEQVSAMIAQSAGQLTEPQEEFLQSVERVSKSATEIAASNAGAEDDGTESAPTGSENQADEEKVVRGSVRKTTATTKSSPHMIGAKMSLEKKKLVTQMWKIMNLTRRIDAIEQGMEKLSGILDDHERILKSLKKETKKIEKKETERSKSGVNVEAIQTDVANLDAKITEVEKLFRTHMEEAAAKLGDVGDMIRELNDMKNVVDDMGALMRDNFTPEKLEKMQNVMDKVKDLDERTSQMFDYIEEDVLSEGLDKFSLSDIPEDMLKNPKHMSRVLQELISQIFKMRERMTDMEDMANILTQGTLAEGGGGGLHDLEDKLDELQVQVERLSASTSELLTERTNTAQLIENLQSCIDHLESMKANKEAVSIALDSKADRSEMEERVTKEDFENTCQELSLGFEEILSKLATQEVACMRAAEELSEGLEKKVDMDMLNNLRQKIQNHIKKVLIKVRKLSEMMDDGPATAAGTKVKCISCDRPSKVEERVGTLRGKTMWVDNNGRGAVEDGTTNKMGRTCTGLTAMSDSGDRYQGGRHTLTYPSQRALTTPDVRGSGEKVWDSINLTGRDNMIYRGVVEKKPQVRETINVDFDQEEEGGRPTSIRASTKQPEQQEEEQEAPRMSTGSNVRATEIGSKISRTSGRGSLAASGTRKSVKQSIKGSMVAPSVTEAGSFKQEEDPAPPSSPAPSPPKQSAEKMPSGAVASAEKQPSASEPSSPKKSPTPQASAAASPKGSVQEGSPAPAGSPKVSPKESAQNVENGEEKPGSTAAVGSQASNAEPPAEEG